MVNLKNQFKTNLHELKSLSSLPRTVNCLPEGKCLLALSRFLIILTLFSFAINFTMFATYFLAKAFFSGLQVIRSSG